MTENFSVHANANQHGKDWALRVTVSKYGPEGPIGEGRTVRGHASLPHVDDELDQAWVVLVRLVHLLEAEGATGRLAGADWPALF